MANSLIEHENDNSYWQRDVRTRSAVHIVRDIKTCEKLWTSHVKPRVLWDLWEVKKAFLKSYPDTLFFVHATEQGKTVGLLPLTYDAKKKKYVQVGDWWPERATFFCRDLKVMDKMLEAVPGPLVLPVLMPAYRKYFSYGITRGSDQYIMNLKRVNYSWNNFLLTLKKKKRQNLRRDVRNISEMKIKIRYDRYEDLTTLFRLNKKQMRRKMQMYDDEEQSIFESDVNEKKVFRNLYKAAGKEYKAKIITVLLNNKIVGVDFGLIYKKTFIAMLGGLDIKALSGIGTFMNYLDVQTAIDEGCDYVDFMTEEHHWKKDWFKGLKRYTFRKE